MFCVRIKNVSKKYKQNQALKNVDLQIPQGQIFGLLGVNGAGKTTLIKSTLSLVRICSGEIFLHGLPHYQAQSRAKTSYLPERFSFFPYYTVSATLDFYADLYGMPKHERSDAKKMALDKLNIGDLFARKIRTLSKGQCQRVGLAAMVMVNADLLFLDEPFSGLDPIGIKDLKALLSELRGKGKTIVMSTHILAEVEHMCEHIAIIDQGQVLKSGPTKELIGNKSLEDYFYELVKKRN